MIHNHEVRSSILRPATKLKALAFFVSAFFVFVPSRELCGVARVCLLGRQKVRIKIVSIPVHVLKLILDSHRGMFDF